MSTDEEYLDSLLKSMEEGTQEKTVFADIMPEKEQDEEIQEEHDTIQEDISSSEQDEEWKESLDELLAAAEATGEDSDSNSDAEYDVEKNELNGTFDAIESSVGVPDSDMLADMLDNMDVTQLIDGMDNTDDDLAEINDLLKKSDNNENIDTSEDEDVAALLDSIKEENAVSKEDEDISSNKKKRKKLRNKKEKTDKKEITDKQKGFWGKLFEQLTREEEEPKEELLDENAEILRELESEDQAKAAGGKGKKEKKKKEKKSKKDKKGGNAPAGDAEEAEEAVDKKGKKKKQKKEKKEKQKKEKPEVPKEKPVKILSRKALFSLIAFCTTIIAAIVLLSIFLPDYSDKKKARDAFYAGEYREVYELLYGMNLNESDELIFNRANVVLKLQRRLDSYELNKDMGKEAQALDALLQGVLKYEELCAGETYGASDELTALYWQILDHLREDYGMSEEEAIEINAFESNAYSQAVYSVINGENPLETSSEEDDAAPILTDVLPEEEDLLQTVQ